MENQNDQDTPTRSSNMEKAEGDRKSEWGEGTSEGATAPVPERGQNTPAADADKR
jgi:hypothetical protein